MSDQPVPLRLSDALFINVAFPMPSSNARKLLPRDAKINLVETLPGQAVLILAFALYRECPFGEYAEVTLAILSSHERTLPIITMTQLLSESRYPAYVLHMFVNNAEAQRLGVETWGLPRRMSEVCVSEQNGRATCEVLFEGRKVLQCDADRPNTDRSRTMQIDTYTLHGGKLMYTAMPCDAQAYGRIQGGGATLRWGDHPIGQRMASLGIKTQPLMVRYYDHMQAELRLPRQIS